jgi:hypothetical protein
MDFIVAEVDPGSSSAFTAWLPLVNLGLAGLFLFYFIVNKIHSHPELERVERANENALAELRAQHQAAITAQKESHAAVMERMDDHVRALILERDKANAERNEAIGIMRDFTIAAGVVFSNQQPPQWQPPRRQGEVSDR